MKEAKLCLWASKSELNGYDKRLYRAGSGNDVMALVKKDCKPGMKRDIILQCRSEYLPDGRNQLLRIHESHQSYLPLAYPLLYPRGTIEAQHGRLKVGAELKKKIFNKDKVSIRQAARYQMMDRLDPTK